MRFAPAPPHTLALPPTSAGMLPSRHRAGTNGGTPNSFFSRARAWKALNQEMGDFGGEGDDQKMNIPKP